MVEAAGTKPKEPFLHGRSLLVQSRGRGKSGLAVGFHGSAWLTEGGGQSWQDVATGLDD